MSLKIRRSDWFIGDLEHYAAWYQSEASWEVAQRYLRAVSTTLPDSQPCLGSAALRDFRSRSCGICRSIRSSDRSRDI